MILKLSESSESLESLRMTLTSHFQNSETLKSRIARTKSLVIIRKMPEMTLKEILNVRRRFLATIFLFFDSFVKKK